MENDEEVKDMETTAESVEKNVETSKEGKKEKTYTRDELNVIINAEKKKARQEALNEMEQKQKERKAEADRLAKMDEDQKKDYQLQEAIKRAEEAEKKLTARDLEAETLKQANSKGIPLDLIKTIDFEKETAESISDKLDIFEKTAKSERERIINEYSKEEPPTTSNTDNETNLSGFEKFQKNMK